MNSIAIFMIPRIINIGYARDFLLKGVIEMCPDNWARIISLAGYLMVDWLVVYFMYRQKIFLKV